MNATFLWFYGVYNDNDDDDEHHPILSVIFNFHQNLCQQQQLKQFHIRYIEIKQLQLILLKVDLIDTQTCACIHNGIIIILFGDYVLWKSFGTTPFVSRFSSHVNIYKHLWRCDLGMNIYKVNIWILIENIQIDMRCLRTKLYTEVFSSENLCVSSIEIRHSGQWTYSYPIRNFLSNFGPKAKKASKELILNYTFSKSFCHHKWKTIKSVLEQSQETENNKTIHIETTITALT